MNRELLLKLTRILNYVTAGLIFLTLASFALPYFNYEGGEQSVISMWGYLGFPANFVQMESLMDVKFLNISNLWTPLILIILGVINMIILLTKKGIATQLFPLIWAICGVIGYFTNRFLGLANMVGRYVSMVLVIIALIVVIVNIVLYVMELKSRTDADYMDLDAWS